MEVIALVHLRKQVIALEQLGLILGILTWPTCPKVMENCHFM